MSKEPGYDLVKTADSNKARQKKLMALDSQASLVNLAQDFGWEFTQNDLDSVQEDLESDNYPTAI
jgi:hypothetical protein